MHTHAPHTSPPNAFEDVRLPVAFCTACDADVLLARDLDDDDRWVRCCARCGHPIPEDIPTRDLDAAALDALGFTPGKLPGEGGCGNGQCGR